MAMLIASTYRNLPKSEGTSMSVEQTVRPSIDEALLQLAEQRFPSWQVLIVGNTEDGFSISRKSNYALRRILDLMPSLGGLTLQTTKGPLSVSRDFPSDAIEFPKHTATRDDPHWSPTGKETARIRAALDARENAHREALLGRKTDEAKDHD